MALRKSLNQRPMLAGVIAVALLVVAGTVLFVWASNRVTPGGRVAHAYYTTDEGKTFFADSIERVYPFDYKGAQAYRAYVYECDGRPFVSYIARYTDAASARLTELKGKATSPDVAGEVTQLRNTAIEVKRPGDTEWVPLFSDAGEVIAQHPTCPDGKTAKLINPPDSGGPQTPVTAGPTPPLPPIPTTTAPTTTAAPAE